MRWDLQLDPVGSLEGNTAVLERARALAAAREREPELPPTPTRETLLKLIAAGTPSTNARTPSSR
jgi:hypothetical protein